MTQPPLTHVKKRSDNIVYEGLSQAQECGVTNQISPFAIKSLLIYLHIINEHDLFYLSSCSRSTIDLLTYSRSVCSKDDETIKGLMASKKRTVLDVKS